MHCFPIASAYHLPDGVEGKDWIVDVLKRKHDGYQVCTLACSAVTLGAP